MSERRHRPNKKEILKLQNKYRLWMILHGYDPKDYFKSKITRKHKFSPCRTCPNFVELKKICIVKSRLWMNVDGVVRLNTSHNVNKIIDYNWRCVEWLKHA